MRTCSRLPGRQSGLQSGINQGSGWQLGTGTDMILDRQIEDHLTGDGIRGSAGAGDLANGGGTGLLSIAELRVACIAHGF